MNNQERRVAVITGGSRGIGSALVSAYRGCGWAVVANARTIDASDDPEIVTVSGDLSDPKTADRIISEGIAHFGRIDTLVNDAGVFITKPFTEYTADDFATIVGVNLRGFFWLTQRAIVEMLKLGGGHVVNISTTLVDYASSDVPSVLVSLTKGGVAAATRSLAIEYASRGIRVNAVSLGVIQTPSYPAKSYTEAAHRHPLERVGQVDDVVNGILFLESSSFITGEIVHIDGGQIAGH